MRHFVLTLFTVFSFFLTDISAQAGNPAVASDTTDLQQQFDDMLRVSNRYQQFRVVKQDFLDAFIQNVEDSIKGYTGEISDLNATVLSQSEKISQLTGDIKERDTSIANLTDEKDSMNLLGMPLSKAAYATIMWGAIFALLGLLVLAFLRMRIAISSARETQANNAGLAEDLAKAKKRRLEVEQDLGRKLQDQINKNRAG